jgi:hypothetical protein
MVAGISSFEGANLNATGDPFRSGNYPYERKYLKIIKLA